MIKGPIFNPVNLFISRDKISDIQKLIFIAIIFASFFLFTTIYFFESGDGSLFVAYADALLHGPERLNPDVARYDIAYPLLLVLSGYFYHHSLIGIAIIHSMMAMMMPVLIYLTVRPAFPKFAYYIAFVSIISLSPFYYMKWIRPDHAYMFFTVLSVCLLSLFIDSKRTGFLYAMTLAVIAACLSRAAGNVLFFFFIFMAFLFGRGSLMKYMVCILIGVCVFSLYSYHRHQFFSQFGNMSSFNGGQTFQNLYLNSKEFGIHLSPDLGPAMKKITDNLYQTVLPRPSLSTFIKENEGSDEFLNAYVYPFSAQEFVRQIYEVPNWNYHLLLYKASQNDPLFFKASWEIVQQYPWYPFCYIARNMWHLLYDPGFSHSQNHIHPYSRMDIHDAFPYYNIKASPSAILFPRAIRELNFDNYSHKFHFVEESILRIKKVFCKHYLKMTRMMFYLMSMAWFAVGIDLLYRLMPSKKLQWIVNSFPKKMTPLVVSISLYLFLNMLIISVFVDPMLRFHNHLIPFKIMLAGMGLGVFVCFIQKRLLCQCEDRA